MKLEYSDTAKKQLKKLDSFTQKRIKKYLAEVVLLDNPRSRGKPLVSNLSGLWRYRVGDYRLICSIEDDRILITVLRLGHRREIYD